eukprot:6181745-Amphidinium_carterae.2
MAPTPVSTKVEVFEFLHSRQAALCCLYKQRLLERFHFEGSRRQLGRQKSTTQQTMLECVKETRKTSAPTSTCALDASCNDSCIELGLASATRRNKNAMPDSEAPGSFQCLAVGTFELKLSAFGTELQHLFCISDTE